MVGVPSMRSLLLDPPHGHPHFRERLSRRQFLTLGAAGSAVAVAAPFLQMKPAYADDDHEHDHGSGRGVPRPIPGTFAPDFPFHVEDPSSGGEPNTLTDFHGFVAVAFISGTGHDENGTKQFFQVDNRFFSGRFVGTDGRKHHGTFGFF